MALTKNINALSRSERFLLIYTYLLFFIVGFVSELGSIGANLAVLLLELIFIVSTHLVVGLTVKPHLSPQGKLLGRVIVAWLVWLLLVSAVSLTHYEMKQWFASLLRGLAYFFHIATAFCFYRLIVFNKINLEKLLWLIPLTCFLIAFNMLVAWNLYPDVRAPDLWIDTPPFYMNIRQGGFHAALGFFVVLGFLYEKKFKEKTQLSFSARCLSYFLAVAMLTFLFWTGGRASALVLYVCLFAWFFTLYYLKLPIKALVFVSLLFSVLAFIISEYLSVMPWNGLLSAFERSTEAENIERLASGRTVMWQFAMENIQQHWLFGLGSDSYFLSENSVHVQPHNSLLQFTMDWGLVGGALSLLILVLAFHNGFQVYRLHVNWFSSFGFLAALALMLTSLLDGTLYHGQTSFYFALALACMFSGLVHKQHDVVANHA